MPTIWLEFYKDDLLPWVLSIQKKKKKKKSEMRRAYPGQVAGMLCLGADLDSLLTGREGQVPGAQLWTGEDRFNISTMLIHNTTLQNGTLVPLHNGMLQNG
jgi:hypothetical protein